MEKIPGTEIDKPTVKLSGRDGNAFAIMGKVQRALKDVGCPKAVIDAYLAESMSGDYDNLLQTAMKYAEVERCPTQNKSLSWATCHSTCYKERMMIK